MARGKILPVVKKKDEVFHLFTQLKQELALMDSRFRETHEKINALSDALISLKAQSKSRIDHLESRSVDLEKHFDKIFDFKESFQKYDRLLSEAGLRETGLENEQKRILDELRSFIKKEDVKILFDEYIVKTLNKLQAFENFIGEVQHSFLCQSNDRKREQEKTESQLCVLREKIDTLETKFDKFSEKIKEEVVNSEWVKDSIRKMNKVDFVLEKKFEYLDDRIKRLKAIS